MSIKKIVKLLMLVGLSVVGFYVTSAFAEDLTLTTIVNNVGGTFKSIGQLMSAAAYLAGFGLTVAAIFKFKQHKDNPQQTPMGTPIAMLLVGVALIFLPNIIAPAGSSIFGSSASVGGFTGEGVKAIKGAGQ